MEDSTGENFLNSWTDPFIFPSATYTPTAGYRGSDSFTFKASDGKLDSNVATVSITVVAVNHAPAAQNLSVTTNEGMREWGQA
jgi:hypothetical protein